MNIVEIVVPIVSLAGAVGLGWGLALSKLRSDRQRLQAARALLDAEWRLLENTRHLREVFLLARRRMQRAADARQRSEDEPG